MNRHTAPSIDERPTDSAVSRRSFFQSLGAGLLIAVTAPAASGQEAAGRQERERGGGGRGAPNLAARLHIARDGTITVMTGKVEGGQGARGQITQAAAEELRVPAEQVRVILGDTQLCPDDGGTYGSQTTPRTVPAVRQAAAAARSVLTSLAAEKWSVPPAEVDARDGRVAHAASSRTAGYGELVGDDSAKILARPAAANVQVTAVTEWKVMGSPLGQPSGRDIVSGRHAYPSDIVRPGMLYGCVLRAPAYGAKLKTIDLAPARAMADVVVVHEGDFVGVAAPKSYLARRAIDALAKTAQWDTPAKTVAVADVYDYLKQAAQGGAEALANPFEADFASAPQALRQEYRVAYVQHAPMEPRAAVAEWSADDRLTVWTATQTPFGVRGELHRAFNLPAAENARVIVPDFGGGFGGKHSGECAIEAARLARAARRPVWLRWTREEEFTWAYFRPAAVILANAALSGEGKISAWHFINVNSGGSGLRTPYRVGEKNREAFIRASEPPLRQGSYRALAATANHFARESFIDELAAAAKSDPLTFRLAHLDEPRMRAVLEAAAQKFDFTNRWKQRSPNVGVGLACGTEKGSFVASCAEVTIDPETRAITVRRIVEAYECGKIINPPNLLSQVQGAMIQGLGPALWEETTFDNGRVTNPSFGTYRVPRLSDLPEMEVLLLDRPDLAPAGAGETPIVTIAPAIGNAVFHATGERVRQMPIRLAPSA